MTTAAIIFTMIGVIQIGQMVAAHKTGLTRKTRPAFTASLTATKALVAKQVMIFDKVWLNNGDIYNPKTGVFTVPMNGLYLVSSSMMSDSGTHLHCHLWRNDQSNVGVFGTGYSQGTLNTVMDLNKGECLTIRHDNRNSENVYGVHWSMFSAYLISE
ncbi:unnamed protein product [Mytilus edulis]|uniref:C1q domain-containing protein n=1 Tax=Mytilus edulis TaxID=6550 RepID=A0A8S3PZM6_MYTED|nr:unnamed protein product [Mytilus edulis]